MKKELLGLLAVAVFCGCGEKKAEQEVLPVKVKTMKVGWALASDGQGYSGTVEEWSGTALSFPTGGTVRQVLVGEGQTVARGQLIATVDASSVANGVTAAQATTSQAADIVAQAQATYAQAKDAYDRMKLLHDNGSLPEIKWIEAETRLQQAETALKTAQSGVRSAKATEQIARKSLSDTRLVAPTSGYIAQKLAEAGQNVLPGGPVVTLVQIDKVKVKIAVPEEEIARIGKGQRVTVRVAALGGRVFTGTIVEKGVTADPLSRSYEVKAAVENPRHELLPGMIAEVKTHPQQTLSRPLPVREGSRKFAIREVIAPLPHREGSGEGLLEVGLVPAQLIQLEADNRTFVWTVKEGRAQKTYVTTGASEGDDVVIVNGLKAGDRVISEGQQKVSSNMKVTE